MAKPTVIQKFISAELKRRGRTPYWLSKECGWASNAVYRKLKRTVNHTAIERMLAVLDIALVAPDGNAVSLGKRGKTMVYKLD